MPFENTFLFIRIFYYIENILTSNIAISLKYILGFSVPSVFVNYVLRSKYMVHLSMTNVPHDIGWLSGSHANTTITIILIWISKRNEYL